MAWRHLKQLEVANALLRTAILFAYSALAYGCTCLIEHPATPTWVPEAPSIWLLQEMVWWRQCPAAKLLSLDQCMCGARHTKPTTLLAVHADHLHLGQLHSGMCRWIAEALVETINEAPERVGTEEGTDDALRWYQTLDHYL